MVKQAAKIDKKSPLLPIAGIVIAVGLGAAARLLVDPLLKALPEVNAALLGSGYPLDNMKWVVAFCIWIVLIGVAYFIVSLLIGKDPNSPKYLPTLPNQNRKNRK